MSARTRNEDGFTLIELLVVILIIGILAAIAVPALINQAKKAYDVEAKSTVHSAQIAMATYYLDHNDYDTDVNGLKVIDPSLQNAALLLNVSGSDTMYDIDAQSLSSTPVVFSLHFDSGAVTRTCSPANTGGCKAGTW